MARVGNFARDVRLIIDKNLSPQARQKIAADAARNIFSEAQASNARVFGQSPPSKQIVDGRIGAPLESVNPDRGKIVFEFALVGPVLEWIGEQLVLNSPVLTGRYRDSHVLLADGVEVDVESGEKAPPAAQYAFVSTVPYARKIEHGLSDQAPDGVFEVVADMAKRRFGNIASIKYSLLGVTGGGTMIEQWASHHSAKEEGTAKQRRQYDRDIRNPAIIVGTR